MLFATRLVLLSLCTSASALRELRFTTTRRVAVGLATALPLVQLPASADECLSCKLKSSIADGGRTVQLGDTIDLNAIAMQASPADRSPSPPPPSTLMVKEVIDVGRDPTKFDGVMKRVLAKTDLSSECVLVWVQSELMDGVPWCPDTRAALPPLERALYRASGEPITLVVADVAKADWRSSSYLYRTHPQLATTGLPTLYRWGRSGPTQRLVEGQITESSVSALLALRGGCKEERCVREP